MIVFGDLVELPAITGAGAGGALGSGLIQGEGSAIAITYLSAT